MTKMRGFSFGSNTGMHTRKRHSSPKSKRCRSWLQLRPIFIVTTAFTTSHSCRLKVLSHLNINKAHSTTRAGFDLIFQSTRHHLHPIVVHLRRITTPPPGHSHQMDPQHMVVSLITLTMRLHIRLSATNCQRTLKPLGMPPA